MSMAVIPRVTKCSHSRVVGLRSEGNLVVIIIIIILVKSGNILLFIHQETSQRNKTMKNKNVAQCSVEIANTEWPGAAHSSMHRTHSRPANRCDKYPNAAQLLGPTPRKEINSCRELFISRTMDDRRQNCSGRRQERVRREAERSGTFAGHFSFMTRTVRSSSTGFMADYCQCHGYRTFPPYVPRAFLPSMYALPVYFGYLTEGQRQMLQRVLHRASSRGFTSYYYDLDTLAENAHYHLFRHSRRQAHCLNHLYTVKPRPSGAMQLRTRGHQFELPAVKYEFNKRNFIVKLLLTFTYLHRYT